MIQDECVCVSSKLRAFLFKKAYPRFRLSVDDYAHKIHILHLERQHAQKQQVYCHREEHQDAQTLTVAYTTSRCIQV